MPTMSGSVLVLANTSSNNVMLGQQYELAPFDGTIEIGAKTPLVGITCQVYSGPDVLQQPGGQVPFGAGAPVYPDDYHWEDEVAAGDRLSLIFTNTTGVNATVYWSVRLAAA